jgi:hypothetical protein
MPKHHIQSTIIPNCVLSLAQYAPKAFICNNHFEYEKSLQVAYLLGIIVLLGRNLWTIAQQ